VYFEKDKMIPGSNLIFLTQNATFISIFKPAVLISFASNIFHASKLSTAIYMRYYPFLGSLLVIS